jgi:hypothetical protein
MANKTELELVQAVKIDLNKLNRGAFSDIRFEKVLYYLNKAFLFLVRKKYTGEDPVPGRLEVNHPVLDDLRPLIREYSVNVADGLSPNTPVSFADNHLFYLSCRMKTIENGCDTSAWVEGRYVKPERVYKELASPFNGSTAEDPIVTISDNKLVIYNEGFDLDEDLLIKYIAKPDLITGETTTEVIVEWYDEIVDVAVLMILDNIENEQRFKTQPGVNVASASE